MPKRSSVVILSSDEEEDAKPKGSDSRVTTRSKASSKSGVSSSVPRSSKPPKKARFSGSRSAPSKEHSGFNEVRYSQNFSGFLV